MTDGWLKIDPITDKVTVTVTENADTVEYDGKEHSVTGYASIVSDHALYDVANVAETPTDAWTAKGTDAGTYPVGIKSGDFRNTSGNFTNVEFVIEDGDLVITPASVAVVKIEGHTKTVTYNWHDSDTSFLEAVLARGDRRMGKVLETAWRKGAHLDAWEEYFSLDRWLEAFEECGLDPHFYANRRRSEDEILPWSMISCGVAPGYLKREHALSYEGVTTPDCRTHCNACGANCLVGGKCDV